MPKPSFTDRELRDSKLQNEIAKQARGMAPDEAFEYIRQLIAIDPKVGLQLSNRVLQKQKHLEALLREGLQIGNASTVRFWLEVLTKRLGFARVVEIIKERLPDDPKSIDRALYWLPLCARDNLQALAMIHSLQESLHPRKPLYIPPRWF
jgi:hypothetical protein